MMRAWGLDHSEVRYEIDQARNEFNGALNRLVAAPENTATISTALKKAKSEWALFEHALKREGGTLVPLIVATTSERLLVTMDEITAMYEDL